MVDASITAIDRLRSISARRSYGSGHVVFRQGDAPDGLYLIASGKVAVQVSNPAGDVLTIAIRGPGDAVGELALVATRRRTATIVTLEPCEIDVVDREQFRRAREQNPAIERMLVDLLAAEVIRLSDRIVETLNLVAHVRLARTLLELADVYGTPGHSGPVRIPITQSDLASISASSRQTCNRALGVLAASGAVMRARGLVVVVDRTMLQRIGAG